MSRGINKVFLLGHLGKDPETKSFPSGGMVCNVSMATSEKWKGRDGQQQEHTEWHNLVFNDKLAEVADKYLRKGSKVLVEGKIRTRKYQDKEGKERYITEIRVSDLNMLDSRREDDESDDQRPSRERYQPQQRQSAPADSGAGGGFGGPDDDIPFNKRHHKEW